MNNPKLSVNSSLETIDENLYNKTMPNETEINNFKTFFEIPSKCRLPYYWTEWWSYSNPHVNEFGNDFETLDRHRSQFPGYIFLILLGRLHQTVKYL